MAMTASKLRQDIYRILDQVIQTAADDGPPTPNA